MYMHTIIVCNCTAIRDWHLCKTKYVTNGFNGTIKTTDILKTKNIRILSSCNIHFTGGLWQCMLKNIIRTHN